MYYISRRAKPRLNQLFSSTSSAVTCFRHESTDAEGLIRELTAYTKAAGHGGARGAGAALAQQAELKRSQFPSTAVNC